MKIRNRTGLSIAGLALGAAVLAPSAVMAASVEPVFHEGNITACPAGYVELEFPGSESDSKTVDGITVTTTVTDGGTTLAFVAEGGVVNIAYIKGGDTYNEYDYGMAGSAADSGLISPDNGGGNTPQISHSVFCANEVEEESSAPVESEVPSESVPVETETPSGSVEAETGTPELEVTPPATDALAAGGGRSSDPTSLLILLASVALAAGLSADRARARARR